MARLITFLREYGRYVVLGLMLVVAGFVVAAQHHSSTEDTGSTNSIFPMSTAVQTPPVNPGETPAAQSDLPLQKMSEIVQQYYLLKPSDTPDDLRARMAPLVSPEVLKSLDFSVGSISKQDQIRLQNHLTERATSNLGNITVDSVDGTNNNLYLTVPVTVQQYLPDGTPFQSSDYAAPDHATFAVFFSVKRNNGAWQIYGFGDARSSP